MPNLLGQWNADDADVADEKGYYWTRMTRAGRMKGIIGKTIIFFIESEMYRGDDS